MKIQIPETCPSCEAKLELVNTQLFCRNSACPAQSTKKVEAYTKVMRIKGFGPKTIEKLDITSIPELYEFTEEDFRLIMGEKMGSKLFNEVEASKNTSLDVFIAALSIPLIGSTAGKKISQVVSQIEDITEEALLEAGIGEKARDNLLNWLATEYLAGGYKDMPVNLAQKKIPIIKQHNKGSVCITGKLNDYKNRTDAANYLESLGYTVTSGVTQKTGFLVDEEGKPSSKRKKAEQLGISIVTIKQLEEI